MGGGETGSNEAKSEPNVVPLCDILLVLLIIFMVITPMVQKGANVKLPETLNYQEQPEPGNMTEVSLKQDGTIYLDNKAIDMADLVGKIQAILEDSPEAESKVLLKADINLEYGKVVDIMNLIKDAEIEVIGLVTEQGTSDI